MKIGSEFKKALNTRLSPIGGGGNPLVAWVLARFSVVKSFVFCVLSCFNKLLCHPELVSGCCCVIYKKNSSSVHFNARTYNL